MITFRDTGSPVRQITGGTFIVAGGLTLDSDATGLPRITLSAGSVGGAGTTGTIPKWTAAATLGDSIMTESGTMVTVAGGITLSSNRFLATTLTQSPGSGVSGVLASLGGTLTEFSSGTHARLSLMELAIPTITGGAASVTNATTLYIAGAPNASGATNRALWVDAGAVKFDGTLDIDGVFTSTVTTGTAPFTVASTTKVTNLNADQLDGIDSTGFIQTAAVNGTTGTLAKFTGTNAVGNSLLTETTSTITMTGTGTEAAPSAIKIVGVNATTAGDAWLTLSQVSGGSDLLIGVAGTDSRTDGRTANSQYVDAVQSLELRAKINGSTYSNAIKLGATGSTGGILFYTAAQSAAATERWRITEAGHLIGGADNTYDIGAVGATRPRTGYFGTSLSVGTLAIIDSAGKSAYGQSTTNANVGIYVTSGVALSGSTSQYGVISDALYSSAVTWATGVQSRIQLATGTVNGNIYAFVAAEPVLQGTATANNRQGFTVAASSQAASAGTYGVYINDQSGGATGNYGLYIGSITGTSAYSIRVAGTAPSWLAGDLVLGSSPATTGTIRFTQGGIVKFRNFAADKDLIAFAVGSGSDSVQLGSSGTDGTSTLWIGSNTDIQFFGASGATRWKMDGSNGRMSGYAPLWLSTSTPTGDVGFVVGTGLTLAGTSQWGAGIWNTVGQDCTGGGSTAVGLSVLPTGEAAGSYTTNDVRSISVGYTKPANQTITTYYGIKVAASPTAGTSYALYTEDKIRVGALGVFSVATAPTHDQILSYDATSAVAWKPRTIQLSFNAGLMVASQLADGTAWTGAGDGGTTEIGSATGPTPSVVVGYHSITVYMGTMPGTAPGANQVYYVYYQKNGAGGWVNGPMKTIGTSVVHTNLDMTATYSYKVKINSGGTLGTASSVVDMASDTNAKTAQVNPFVLVAASQISTVNLAAINADIGRISAGMLQNDATQASAAIRLNDTYSLPGKYPVTSGMLSHSGMSAFTAANCVNDNLGDNAWHTDTAVAGAYIQIDLGSAKTICRAGMYCAGSGNTGRYKIQYSSDAASWFDATDSANVLAPAVVGWTRVGWKSVGAFRYWRMTLLNTPGASSWLNELELSTLAHYVDFASTAVNLMELGGDRFVLGTTGQLTVRATVFADSLSVSGAANVTGHLGSASGISTKKFQASTNVFFNTTQSPGQTVRSVLLDNDSVNILGSTVASTGNKNAILGTYSVTLGTLTQYTDTTWSANAPTAQASSVGAWATATDKPLNTLETGTLPAYDGYYTVQFDVTYSQTALNVSGYLSTTWEILWELDYDNNGVYEESGVLWSQEVYSQADVSTALTNQTATIVTASTLTSSSKFRFTYRVRIFGTKVLSGTADISGNGDNVSWWASGATNYSRRALYLNAEANKPQLTFQPVTASAPTTSNAQGGEFWYDTSVSPHALSFVDWTNGSGSPRIIRLGAATTTQEGVVIIAGRTHASPSFAWLRTAGSTDIDVTGGLGAAAKGRSLCAISSASAEWKSATQSLAEGRINVCHWRFQDPTVAGSWSPMDSCLEGASGVNGAGSAFAIGTGTDGQMWLNMTCGADTARYARQNTAGTRGGTAQWDQFPFGSDPTFTIMIRTPASFTNLLFFAGMSNQNQGPGSVSAEVAGDFVGIRLMGSTLTGRVVNGGVVSTLSLGTLTANTVYVIKIRCVSRTSYYSLDGGTETSIGTTNAPLASDKLGIHISCNTTAAASTSIDVAYMHLEYGL